MNNLNLTSWIKQGVLEQPAYSVIMPRHTVKLNQNESPYDWPTQVKSEIMARLMEMPWNRYPEQTADSLRLQLADYTGTEPDQILMGNGSNEILQAIASVVIRPGDTVTTLSPTFAVYSLLAQRYESRVNVSQLDSDFQLVVGDLLAKCRDSHITFLAAPNSPTGTAIPLDQIELVAQATSGLVVVDEAYYEFTGTPSAIQLLDSCPNLIVTRTCSKAFGLAAFRFGYAVMAGELARELGKGLLPFNLDVPTIIATEVIMEQLPFVKDQVQRIIDEREGLIRRINRLKGYRAYPSQANFFLLKGPSTAEEIFKIFLRSGILVRDVSAYPGCEELVRITVGTPEQNSLVIKALESAL